MKSSVIASIGFDAETNTMEIEFKTGRIYDYFEITPPVHAALVNAVSIGQYFNAKIRDRFPCREITKGA